MATATMATATRTTTFTGRSYSRGAKGPEEKTIRDPQSFRFFIIQLLKKLLNDRGFNQWAKHSTYKSQQSLPKPDKLGDKRQTEPVHALKMLRQ